MIQLRLITAETRKADHSIASRWLRTRGLYAMPLEILPICGVVAENDGKPVAMAWMYRHDVIAFIAFPVSNPAAEISLVGKSLEAVFDFLERDAKRQGFPAAFFASRPKSLGRLAERRGWTKFDSGVDAFVKDLTKMEGVN
jgi:hypothetical protein